jgi:hypothetical protein
MNRRLVLVLVLLSSIIIAITVFIIVFFGENNDPYVTIDDFRILPRLKETEVDHYSDYEFVVLDVDTLKPIEGAKISFRVHWWPTKSQSSFKERTVNRKLTTGPDGTVCLKIGPSLMSYSVKTHGVTSEEYSKWVKAPPDFKKPRMIGRVLFMKK